VWHQGVDTDVVVLVGAPPNEPPIEEQVA
jgi:hypothetical protein